MELLNRLTTTNWNASIHLKQGIPKLRETVRWYQHQGRIHPRTLLTRCPTTCVHCVPLHGVDDGGEGTTLQGGATHQEAIDVGLLSLERRGDQWHIPTMLPSALWQAHHDTKRSTKTGWVVPGHPPGPITQSLSKKKSCGIMVAMIVGTPKSHPNKVQAQFDLTSELIILVGDMGILLECTHPAPVPVGH